MTVQTNLSRKAMLAVLNISRWSARKHDKKVSQEVSENHGANGNVGRYHKRLLPGDSKSLDRVRKSADAARDFHYQNTLPWGQDGSRVLTKANYFAYVTEMRKLRTEFEEAVQAFIREYPELRVNARNLLGTMYSEDDYPTTARLEGKFGFDLLFLPFPDAQDFRVDLDDDEQQEIKKSIEQHAENATALAMRDVWNRLYEAVSRMTERLGNPDNIFRDSLVTNVRDLCELLPRLNIANDPNLDKMVQAVSSKLASHDAQTLRDVDTTRAKVALDAAQIADMMRQYMG
jgi:hypothetical protein